MKEINETWYAITNWDGSVDDVSDKALAKLALKEGKEVSRTKRVAFVAGTSDIYLTVTTVIKQQKDL